MTDRCCLSCKGSGYVYNYNSFKYTFQKCECCKDGRVPANSADDGFGPLSFTQHIRSTDIKMNNRVVGSTTDIRESRIPIEEATVRLNGLFTIRELEGMAAMLHKLRESGCKVNCDCCQPRGHYDDSR